MLAKLLQRSVTLETLFLVQTKLKMLKQSKAARKELAKNGICAYLASGSQFNTYLVVRIAALLWPHTCDPTLTYPILGAEEYSNDTTRELIWEGQGLHLRLHFIDFLLGAISLVRANRDCPYLASDGAMMVEDKDGHPLLLDIDQYSILPRSFKSYGVKYNLYQIPRFDTVYMTEDEYQFVSGVCSDVVQITKTSFARQIAYWFGRLRYLFGR